MPEPRMPAIKDYDKMKPEWGIIIVALGVIILVVILNTVESIGKINTRTQRRLNTAMEIIARDRRTQKQWDDISQSKSHKFWKILGWLIAGGLLVTILIQKIK